MADFNSNARFMEKYSIYGSPIYPLIMELLFDGRLHTETFSDGRLPASRYNRESVHYTLIRRKYRDTLQPKDMLYMLP